MSLLPVLFRWPLALLPVHIVFLELIIDPACSIVFEAENEEADVMRRPPRDPRARLVGWRTLAISLAQADLLRQRLPAVEQPVKPGDTPVGVCQPRDVRPGRQVACL